MTGWTLDACMTADLAIVALERVSALPQLPRGSYIMSIAMVCIVQRFSSAYGFIVFIRRRENYLDITKSFFETLKTALLCRQVWMTFQEVEPAITFYVNDFYNSQWVHSALNRNTLWIMSATPLSI
ncbi:IS3 family transposase [Acetobacter orleanensis]